MRTVRLNQNMKVASFKKQNSKVKVCQNEYLLSHFIFSFHPIVNVISIDQSSLKRQ